MKASDLTNKILSSYFGWLVGGVAVIILGLGYTVVLSAQLSLIQTTSLNEKTQTEQRLKTETEYLAALKGSITRFHQVLPNDKIGAIDDFLPSSSDFPGLLLTLKNLAASANVQLESLNLSQTGQVAASPSANGATSAAPGVANAAAASSLNLKTQDASIAVAGGTSYDDFKHFLSVIEHSRRLLDVIQLSFGVSPGGQSAAQSYAMVVRTYYLPSAK